MSYRDLREFLQVLEREGVLKRITAPVDPILEIAEITDRVTKASGPALLFERVKGSAFPVLINTFGTERRMNLALGVKSIDELGDILTELLEVKTPESLLDKIRLLPKLKDLASAFPKRVNDGPCKEVIIRDDPRLDIFPIIQCWPKDGGRYITFPLVFTKDPETGIRNVGTYRMQVFDAKTTAMHWHTHKGGAAHYRKYKRLGKR
ncbi:MAG TPA: UbiD family decarboxylase domain-containing protein, partial [Candidatus Methylomirabilis sp.]